MSHDPISLDEADRMLSFVRGVEDRNLWVRMAYVLKGEFGEEGFDLWDSWSRDGGGYSPKNARAVWKSCKASKSSIGALVALAKEGGYQRQSGQRRVVSEEERRARAMERAHRLYLEAEQEKRDQEEAARIAADMWERAAEDGHAYLARKGIKGESTRVLSSYALPVRDDETGRVRDWNIRDVLLVPLRHGPNQLVGMQMIFPDGEKHFIKGAPVAGAYCSLGKASPRGVIVVAEGYATAESIYRSTGFYSLAAMNAGNLLAVAAKARAAAPEAEIVIAADDDRFIFARVVKWLESCGVDCALLCETNAHDGGKGWKYRWDQDESGVWFVDAWCNGIARQFKNAGMVAAHAAAKAVSGRVVSPAFASLESRGTDFNDLMLEEGAAMVKSCFNRNSG